MMNLKTFGDNKIMVELIVTIFAGLGFFSLVHFSVHLIEKMNKNIKSPKNKELYYWYITFACPNGCGCIFVCTNTILFEFKKKGEEIKEGIPKMKGGVIITSFVRISKELYEINKSK